MKRGDAVALIKAYLVAAFIVEKGVPVQMQDLLDQIDSSQNTAPRGTSSDRKS